MSERLKGHMLHMSVPELIKEVKRPVVICAGTPEEEVLAT